MTRLVRLDSERLTFLPPEVFASLREGGMVIYPTDTLYGLGVNPLSDAGLSRLLAAKSRDRGKPIPLLLSGPEEVERWARHVPAEAARLMDRFWPGALTLVLPSEPGIHPAITGGGDTVGLRVPDHPVPRALARGMSGAVTGTSANRSGNPGAWESAEEIVREFTGEVDWVLWDGRTSRAAGAEGGAAGSPGSTVVRMTDDRPVLLREGVVPFRAITEFLEKE
ncbi:MAG: threonylcarbamoyl-AMP synthase [Deltaproteobacteria bacterium]|nr:threonylcarbamoyl-AMP synthase [Deltaproteobacteria bacterium]